MTPDEFRDHMRRATDKAGGVKAWASAHGFSRQYVSNVLHDRAPPSEKVLTALGVRVVTEYEVASARPVSAHLTLLDCTQECNRVQARWELHRATSGAALAAWARKWGEALIIGYETHSADAAADIAEAEGRADDGWAAASVAEMEAEEAQEEVATLERAIADTIDELRPIEAFHSTIPTIIERLEKTCS
jgi:hypothetical protein